MPTVHFIARVDRKKVDQRDISYKDKTTGQTSTFHVDKVTLVIVQLHEPDVHLSRRAKILVPTGYEITLDARGKTYPPGYYYVELNMLFESSKSGPRLVQDIYSPPMIIPIDESSVDCLQEAMLPVLARLDRLPISDSREYSVPSKAIPESAVTARSPLTAESFEDV